MAQVDKARVGQPRPTPGQQSGPDGQPKATRRCVIAAADSHGVRQQGELILAEEWSPEFGRFDPSETEAFRIVLLSQTQAIPCSAVAPGVGVCIPSADVSPPRFVRETATAYETKRTSTRAAEGIETLTLSRGENASLASGQLLASPPLDLDPADVFPPGETRPRFEPLARALLDQQRARPYLRALGVSLAAPADAGDDHDLGALLQPLRQVLLAALKAPGARDAPLLDFRGEGGVRDRLTRLAKADTIPAFADEACQLYAGPVNLGEDVYRCRALVDRPREAVELARMRAYVGDAVVPESARPELALDRTLTAEQLSFAVLVAEPHRWPGMRAAFEHLHQAYRSAYLEHHHRYWEEALMLHAQLMDTTPHAQALRRLNSLRELGEPLGEAALTDHEELPMRIGACLRSTCLDRELRQRASCPECGISMADQLPWEAVQGVKHRLQRALDQQLHRLSSKAVRQILARSGEARIQEFLQIVQASQVQSLAHVLDDELLGFIRRFLVEARVHSLIGPLLAKLQNITPDVDEETVEAVTTEVGRIIQDAFTDAQRALPQDVRLELSPGTTSPGEESA